MKKVPAAILLGYLIVSLGCVTFAWMSEPEAPKGKIAVLEYFYGTETDPNNPTHNHNTLTIESKTVTCTAWGYNEATDAFDLNLDSFLDTSLFGKSGILPGDSISLKFSFTNSSSTKAVVSLNAFNIETSNEDIFDYMIFGIYQEDVHSTIYTYDSVVGTYTSFTNARGTANADGKYSCCLIDEIEIIPTIEFEDQTVDIYCYIMLANSTPSRVFHPTDPAQPDLGGTYSSIEGATFSLGNFRVIK